MLSTGSIPADALRMAAAYSWAVCAITPFFPLSITSRLPTQPLTTQNFFKYIASKSEIGNPSQTEGSRNPPHADSSASASFRSSQPVTRIFSAVSNSRCSPSPIQTNEYSGKSKAISLNRPGDFCGQIRPIVATVFFIASLAEIRIKRLHRHAVADHTDVACNAVSRLSFSG